MRARCLFVKEYLVLISSRVGKEDGKQRVATPVRFRRWTPLIEQCLLHLMECEGQVEVVRDREASADSFA